MSALKELVIILDRHKSEQLKGWLINNKTTNQGQLYHFYLKHGQSDDKKACDLIYGKNADNGKFRKLKSDLRNSLEDLALFINIKAQMNKDSLVEKAIVNKEFATFHNLLLVGANLSLVDKGERLFERSVKIGSNLIAKTVAQILITRSAIKQSKEKYNFYSQEIVHLGKVLEAEEKGLVAYTTIQKWTMNTKASHTPWVEEGEKIVREYKNVAENLSSPAIDYFNIMLELYLYSLANDGAKVLALAEKGVDYFNNQIFFYKTYVKSFYYYLIVGYGYRREYEKALVLGEQNLEWEDEGSSNWLKTLELLTYAAL